MRRTRRERLSCVETKQLPLGRPVDGYFKRQSHQLLGGELRRIFAVNNRSDDIGRQRRKAQEARDRSRASRHRRRVRRRGLYARRVLLPALPHDPAATDELRRALANAPTVVDRRHVHIVAVSGRTDEALAINKGKSIHLPMLIVSLRGQSNADDRAAAQPNDGFLNRTGAREAGPCDHSVQPSFRASSFAASQASFSNSSRVRGHSLSIWMSEDW
jgi:hypothetical protein